MATLTADEIRSRVETDWNRIVKVLAEKVALQSISAKGNHRRTYEALR